MLSQLGKLERRLKEIENLLSSPETASDNQFFRKLSQEASDIRPIVGLFLEYKKLEKQLSECQELFNEPSMHDIAFEEAKSLEQQLVDLKKQLSFLLLPKDPHDDKNVFVEIRAGAGGDEASLFAADLFRMYTKFCEGKGWRVSIASFHENEMKGFKEIVGLVEGQGVYSILKYESGVHRVQRVPVTESQGRVHTSTVTVAILPEADDVDIKFSESDLRVDTYRASGAGGQHVNRTDSAVRLTHIPTGIVVACQDERSQIKNKSKALKILQAKLQEKAEDEQRKSVSEERKSLIGRGDRSERIRTYNFPQSRVTDHRIGVTVHSIPEFLDGNISDMLKALQEHDRAEALKGQSFT